MTGPTARLSRTPGARPPRGPARSDADDDPARPGSPEHVTQSSRGELVEKRPNDLLGMIARSLPRLSPGFPPRAVENLACPALELARCRPFRSCFAETVAAHPDRVALRWKAGDAFAEWTWPTTPNGSPGSRPRCATSASGAAIGSCSCCATGPSSTSPTRRSLLLGATPVSIYNSSAPEQVQYLVGHSEASVAIVEDIGFLERFLKVRSELPALRHVAIVDDPDAARAGRRAPVGRDARRGAARRSTPSSATRVPTTSSRSSTRRARPGPPKGVTLDHENMDWTMSSFREAAGVDPTGWRVVSYLPMAHVAERTVSHYMGVTAAYEVTTCPDPGLLVPYLVQNRPQFFFAVPRVWEKAHAALRAAVGPIPRRPSSSIKRSRSAGRCRRRRRAAKRCPTRTRICGR